MVHVSLPFGWCLVVGLAVMPVPLGAQSAPYVPYSGIVTGTEGADPVVLSVRNAAGGEIACAADLAHWYSQPLGVAAPGGSLAVALWHDPATGVVSLLNPGRDRMPIEALWCGLSGQAFATRGRIAVPQVAGPVPAALSVTCRMADTRLICPGD